MAATGAQTAQIRHRDQLLAYRDAQHHRAEQLSTTAERLMQLVVASVHAHLEAGTLLQPGQLGAALGSAARALEASGSTEATALGIDELELLLAPKLSGCGTKH